MIDRFRAHLRANGLFPAPGIALLAVSGGPDSIALLRLMHAVAGDHELGLAVGHVDHGIHPHSAAWSARVRALAEGLGHPVHVAALGLGAGTAETRAREARYAALEGMRVTVGARYLVTAHHADDQVETVLFRVLRGSGPAGLAGMAAVRGALVRPLLAFRRADLTPYAEGAVLDPANDDHGHDRSWIRGALLPLLRERFGERLEDNVLALAAHAAEDRSAWDRAASLVPGLRVEVAPRTVRCARKALAALDPELGAAIARALARRADLVLRPRHAERLMEFVARPAGGRTLELGGGLTATVDRDILTIAATGPPVST